MTKHTDEHKHTDEKKNAVTNEEGEMLPAWDGVNAERVRLRRQVSLLREIFSPYDRVEAVQRDIEILVTRESEASEGGILKLLGPSRSGKTKIIRDFARRYAMVEKGVIGSDGDFADLMPVICIRVPDTNIKNLLELLVATLSRRSTSDIRSREFRRFDLQKTAFGLAREVGLRLLCLEETHDAIESRGDKAAKVAAAVLKDLSNESCFSLVISGTEATQRLFDLNEELEGRVLFDHDLSPFRWDDAEDRAMFLEILLELDMHLQENVFGRLSGLTDPELARRLLRAGRGVIGHVATLIESAAMKAVDSGAKQLELSHFVAAFAVSPLRRHQPDAFPIPAKFKVGLAEADAKSGLRGRTRRAGNDVIFKR